MTASARGRSAHARADDFSSAFNLCLLGRMTKTQALVMAKAFSRRGFIDAEDGCMHYVMAVMIKEQTWT